MAGARQRRRGRVASFYSAVAAGSLSVFLLGAAMIGQPPAFGINALWVYDHRFEVRFMVLALAVAIAATGGSLVIGARRGVILAIWALATLASLLFADSICVIAVVMWGHYG